MFLIDTNVISESRKVRSGRAAQEVVAWLNETDPSTTFISSMSLFELELSVVRVERRDPTQGANLRRWLDSLLRLQWALEGMSKAFALDLASAGISISAEAEPRPFAV